MGLQVGWEKAWDVPGVGSGKWWAPIGWELLKQTKNKNEEAQRM